MPRNWEKCQKRRHLKIDCESKTQTICQRALFSGSNDGVFSCSRRSVAFLLGESSLRSSFHGKETHAESSERRRLQCSTGFSFGCGYAVSDCQVHVRIGCDRLKEYHRVRSVTEKSSDV